jgi:hypothetical protein
MVYLGGGVQPGYEVICLNEYDSHGAILNGGGTAGSGSPGPSPVASNAIAPIPILGFSTQSGATWCVAGQVGSDVLSVVINTIEHGPVEATIQNGWFGAWWPGPSLDIHKIAAPPTYTLTLKDGTIRAKIRVTELGRTSLRRSGDLIADCLEPKKRPGPCQIAVRLRRGP